jgi:SAM-dependent methyltransferase
VANALFERPDYNRYPLDLNYCTSCGHLQLSSAPNPDGVFADYRYKSGVSASFRRHFIDYADMVCGEYGIGHKGRALEIGSNDGFLLQQFRDRHGLSVIGVEPSTHLKQEHEDKNIPVVVDFFTTGLVKKFDWQNEFDFIFANNVLAHIPDTLDVVQAISDALRPGGVLVAECGDQSGIFSGEFLDNVYHEHIDYYSPHSFATLLNRVGLHVDQVVKVDTHGLSFRLIARKVKENDKMPAAESIDLGETRAHVIDHLSRRETRLKTLLNSRKFVSYGAAAKAVTALYSLNMVGDMIGAVDDNELKQGYYFPGTNILITSPTELDPDALVLVTAWNVFEDIKAKLLQRGHRGEIICMQ